METQQDPVLQLRVIIEAADYERAVRFYRDVLGMPEFADFSGEGEDRVTILDAGRATVEIASTRHKEVVDEVETAGAVVAPAVRLAFEVTDAEGVTRRLVDAGAILLAGPVVTPWQSLNSRLDAPADQQITVFQELGME